MRATFCAARTERSGGLAFSIEGREVSQANPSRMVGMASLKLKVTGMTCGHCKTKVEKALQGVRGTYGAAVFQEEGEAEVDYDPAKAEPAQYVTAVEQAGYHASVAE
jgi:copper chaperone